MPLFTPEMFAETAREGKFSRLNNLSDIKVPSDPESPGRETASRQGEQALTSLGVTNWRRGAHSRAAWREALRQAYRPIGLIGLLWPHK